MCQTRENINRTFLYIIWGGAGFCSELNQLLLAFAYSVASKRHFLIDSRQWNYGNFNDYFNFEANIFYSLSHYTFLSEINLKNDQIEHLKTTRTGSQVKTFWVATRHVQSIEIKRRVAHYLWQRMTKETKLFIQKYRISNISNYIGIHIRRGDKLVKEARVISLQKYIEIIERRILVKNISQHIFVSSDDHLVIDELCHLKPTWNFVSIYNNHYNNTQRHGHFQSQFNRLSSSEKLFETRLLMCELQMLIDSQYVLCSMSSNVCRFIQILRHQHPSTVISLDRSWFGT
ncbi:unnamed protein product [Rotaria sp. Silwood1]|nr:unnamed protein product [Rotaria sp. Silwood1]CAF3636227.1 unnamed protein product [Rotaria sp. Silwood1]CAF3658244.1 unnamed protein product [Rotaria sp. Silwood1]CAF4910216.1 unnamed protein product [Rotaria sp. Silwood1]CAF4960515.1 unnamed protein product [Rotaria sp. Silwood1]